MWTVKGRSTYACRNTGSGITCRYWQHMAIAAYCRHVCTRFSNIRRCPSPCRATNGCIKRLRCDCGKNRSFVASLVRVFRWYLSSIIVSELLRIVKDRRTNDFLVCVGMILWPSGSANGIQHCHFKANNRCQYVPMSSNVTIPGYPYHPITSLCSAMGWMRFRLRSFADQCWNHSLQRDGGAYKDCAIILKPRGCYT